MFFTLYGVYIRHFADEIWQNSLIKLMTEFGFTEQAVRASLARLAAQGWVELRKEGRNSYLKMTSKGLQRVNEAATRIYRQQRETWNGDWFLLTYTIPEDMRGVRDQLRTDLSWWGFGMLGTSTWLTPHDLRDQMAILTSTYGIEPYVAFFTARYHGPESNRALVEKSWNLTEVNGRYREFLGHFEPLFAQNSFLLGQNQLTDRDCFVQRTRLVHEYRKFLFADPALPEELLAADWLGGQAFQLFQRYDHLLAEGAGRFFYSIFQNGLARPLPPTEAVAGLRAQLDPFSYQLSAVSR